jgi:hypothetical protein
LKTGTYDGLKPQLIRQKGAETPLLVRHAVPRSAGRPLDTAARPELEGRFAHDFSRVRVHTDETAALTAEAAGAQAYTAGDHLFFGAGQYRPSQPEGKRLLAHELAHVVQQRGPAGASPAREGALEVEADTAANAAAAGQAASLSSHAAPGMVQFARKKIKGREFEIDDVNLNAAASTDVRTHGNLLPSKDQAHIVVDTTNSLGYEVSYTTPEDPFRWSHLKDIVDKGHVTIAAVGLTDTFKVKEVKGGKESIVPMSLATTPAGMAGGITLPRLSTEKAIYPGKSFYVASTDDTHDQVFYETGKGGRGLIGGNSLAHELFGHLWLAMQGIPYGHGDQIKAPAPGSKTPAILDPLGRVYSGSVTDYINQFAGSSGTILQSPTRFVGTQFVSDATSWIMKEGAKHLSWKTVKGQKQSFMDADFALHWEILSQNYEILTVGPQQPAAPTVQSAAGLVTWVVGWFNSQKQDTQKIFLEILNAITWGFSKRSTKLAQEVMNQINKQAATPPAATPTQKGTPSPVKP